MHILISIFKVRDHVRTSTHSYKRVHSKLARKSFVIKKVKDTVGWKYVIEHFNNEEVHNYNLKSDKKKKVKNNMLSGKVLIILLTAGSLKEDITILNEFLSRTRSS